MSDIALDLWIPVRQGLKDVLFREQFGWQPLERFPSLEGENFPSLDQDKL